VIHGLRKGGQEGEVGDVPRSEPTVEMWSRGGAVCSGSMRTCCAKRPSFGGKEVGKGRREVRATVASGEARRWEVLDDPVRLRVQHKAKVRVQDAGGPAALDAYMRLPVEKYNILDPERVSRVGTDDFELRVGKLEYFGVTLDPIVTAKASLVEGEEPHVHIKSTNCVLNAGGILGRFDLDDRFHMQMSTKLFWETGKNGKGKLGGDCAVDVWCEVIPPFHRLPRSVLEGSCNSVMKGIVCVLLPSFVKFLRDDYLHWASNAEERVQRGVGTNPQTQSMETKGVHQSSS